MQILPKCLSGMFFADAFPQYSAIHAGLGFNTNGGGGAPMVLPGTVSNLVLYDGEGFDFDVTIYVAKNFSGTALNATLLAGAAGRIASNTTEIPFAEGDSLEYEQIAGVHAAQTAGCCVELASQALLFGVDADVAHGIAAGGGTVASAFGNGFFASYGGDPSVIGGSICAINGTITRLGIKRYASVTGGSWKLYVIKNGSLQADTFELDDTDAAYGAGSVAIPCVPGDLVSVLLVRLGTDSGFAIRQAGVGLAFTPSTPGQFMICGGSNDEIPTNTTTWKWTRSPQGGATEGVHTAPAGLSDWSASRLFIKQSPNNGGTITDTILKNGTANGLSVSLSGLQTRGDELGLARYSSEDLITLEIVSDSIFGNRVDWALGAGAGIGQIGVIGPLAWWHRRKRLPNGTVVSIPHSDQDMKCPGVWYEGFKESDVIEFGDAERRGSDPVTGDWSGNTFRIRQSDTSRTLRQELASTTNRYWVGSHPVYMTDRQTRADLGIAYCVFNGPIVDAQPTREANAIDGQPSGMGFDITLGDIVSRQLISDQAFIPWKQFKDSNLKQFAEVAESLDREAPEQIILGRHRRVPDIDPASPEGFIYTPILMGKYDLGIGGGSPFNLWWVWQVAGHAVAGIPDAYVIDPSVGPHPSSILADEGTIWLIPHHGGFNAHFGAPYHDVRSDTYGNARRVTRIYGKVGEPVPDACAQGTLILAVAVDGVEPNGDGSGECITDPFEQYKYFFNNYVSHSGPESYQTDAPLGNPEWDIIEGPVPILNEDSVDACKAIAAIRLPTSVGSPNQPGYVGACIIGANGGDRLSVARWLAWWNLSLSARSGVNHFGQWTLGMLHPTQAIKDAAPLIEETNDILIDSFQTPILTSQQANRVPFVADYEHTTGRWMTSDHADADASITNYGGNPILGDERQYRMAPGITMAYHLARMTALEFQHAPRGVTLAGTIGADPNGFSLGYLDLFSYFRYRHFASISDTAGEIRLAWISILHAVQTGRRTVRIEAIDVDDLIDFDLPSIDLVGSPATTNDECAHAIDMGALESPFDATYDTTFNNTDETSDFGSPSLLGDLIPYHAAWFKMTGNIFNGTATFSTEGSQYDTQMWVFSGSCGTLSPVDYNDNFGTLLTSVLDVDIVGGTDYFILVAGFGPEDGGFLQFHAVFTPD